MNICPYCGKEYIDTIASVKKPTECPCCMTNFKTGMPPKSKLNGIEILFLIIGIGLIGLSIGLLVTLSSLGVVDGSPLIITLIGVLIIYVSLKRNISANNLYDLAKKNPKEYKRQVTELRKKDEARTQKQNAEREEKLAHLPACPICGSKEHVERITNTDRTVEVAVWGLGASSVGKQFECRKCHHAFNADNYMASNQDDPTEELRKYKRLLDDGIISQDEFDSKKKQILDL